MAAPEGHSPHQNHLLDALPASAYERLASHLELVPMRLGEVLYESGVQLRHLFPHHLHSFAPLCHAGWRIR
jgi:hypothetical protein